MTVGKNIKSLHCFSKYKQVYHELVSFQVDPRDLDSNIPKKNNNMFYIRLLKGDFFCKILR